MEENLDPSPFMSPDKQEQNAHLQVPCSTKRELEHFLVSVVVWNCFVLMQNLNLDVDGPVFLNHWLVLT